MIDSENLEERLAAVRGIRTVAAGLVKLLNDEITVLSVIPQGVSDRGTREIRDLLVNRSYNVLVAANYMLELARRRTNVSEDSDEYGPGVVLAVEEARQGFSDAEHRRIEVASITVDQQARRLLAGLRGKIGRLES
ncbi:MULTISPECIES: hypothetical protein [Streptacidiphilus]|uniref:Uncharacterized protein n=1 Tax=Streptacidiphilus cavernicola TaxID=3342716 RepID=A0ABV6UXC3_9ACTN|nr:hypothetical protein [Streptacidiphilus jeojiense]